MDINEVSTTEDLWTPYKELAAVVDSHLSSEGGGAPYAVHTFEAVLRRHKQTFLALLGNPPKNPTSREEIKRGVTEGVTLPSIGRTVLSKELVDEAIIISDMFNVNEYLALELLHTAQRRAPRHPGLARGLLAVALYYDGRRALLRALLELLQARDGVCWCINAREDIVKYVTRYVEQLIRDGLLGGALDALRGYTLAGELQLLQQHRALPPREHHARLARSIEDSRRLLAQAVFAAAAQRGLERDTLLRLMAEQTTAPSQGPTGALDEVSLALQMALLYALDLSVLHRREDGEELARRLPLLQDPELLDVLVRELLPDNSRPPGKEPRTKAGQGARALCQLSLGLALAALRRAPQSLSLSLSRDQEHRDEELVDAATDNKVFEYLDSAVLSTELVAREEYYQRRVHALLTDFIVLMHPKLAEMRVKADEAARAIQVYAAEGLAPPAGAGQSRGRLDALLRCVERLYARDPLGLRYEYWPAEPQHPPPRSAAGGRATLLHKFARLSGSLVCGALLPGYLRALGSLAVPAHTWALLARRDALSAHHLLSALRRYHCHLRTDLAPFAEPLHAAALGGAAVLAPAARPGKMLVRHEEVEAMVAALKLLGAVARVDAAAAAAICENLQWDAANTMFGLMCCQIPITLKAALCDTLAALGGAAGPAARVWAALEAAQLVAGPRGVHADLLEVETRMEEYPLTEAFLRLLLALCSAAPPPRALGAGARVPGLDPYVEYVVARVALPAPHRPYKRPAQRHQVLALVYSLLSLWLQQHSPAEAPAPGPGAAPAPGREPAAAPAPGARVLAQLHAPTELLALVLSTLDEVPAMLDAPDDQPQLVECVTHVLTMLEHALALERALVRGAGAGEGAPGRPAHLLGLSKLLLEPGPHDSDRLTSCCRVLAHAGALPECAARAAALLARALLEPAAARHLHAQAAHRTPATRHWFVECLDAEERGAAGARRAKELVVGVLQHTLRSAPPNLAQLLLGYRPHEDVSQCALHEPGVGGAPRSCLHAVLDLLDAHVAQHDRQADSLVEGCYRLLYRVCARADTGAPALRLLRARDHFLARHVAATRDLQTASLATLSSRSWVLRACASEVGSARPTRQAAAVAALLRALAAPAHQEWESEGCLLRRCLSALPVSAPPPPEPQWELFNPALLAQAVASCDLPAGPSSRRISVSRVHALLARELAALPASQPQRALVCAEIQKVLDYVTEVNKQRNLAATLTHYYDSWRQLAEIIFCVAPADLLPVDTKKNLLISILQDLLNKIPDADAPVVPQLAVLASGTVLLLLVNLRHCYLLQRRESNSKTSDFETTFFGPARIVQTKSLPLKFILHKILGWIMVSGDQSQKLRVNLYGALLNFLHIVNAPPPDDEDGREGTYVSRLDASRAEEGSLRPLVAEELEYYGVGLYGAVAGDCVRAGHDACRLAALASLHVLVGLDPRTDWLDALANQGFLRTLIDSIVADDDALREALEPSPSSLRAIYLYESRMSLLIRVARWPAGAAALLAHGALPALAELRVLRAHPDLHAPDPHAPHAAGFVPDQATRYRQLLLPALALCHALLTTLGAANESCVRLVLHLLFTHLDCVDMVLRAAQPTSSPGLLAEVEALTSLLARCSGCPAVAAGDPSDAGDAERGARTRALLAALLVRFQRAPADQRDLTTYYKIVCNVLTFSRNTLEAWAAAGAGHPPGALPPHSAVLALLQEAVARAHGSHKARATALHQLRATEDMKALMPAGGAAGGGEDGAEGGAAARARSLSQQLQQCAHAACLALHLLWRMAQCTTHTHTAPAPNGTWQEPPGLVPGELRRELAAAFSERFTASLLDCAETQSTQRFFLDVIVKDIKTMMQF